MREIDITEDCLNFIDQQEEKTKLKIFYLIEIIGEIKIVISNFLKKLQSTQFYELRVKTGKEIRIIIFEVDHLNFAECKKAVCLWGFQKKSTKDYKKARKKAEMILKEYQNEK